MDGSTRPHRPLTKSKTECIDEDPELRVLEDRIKSKALSLFAIREVSII